jgi:PAS domain S-box-containing protein
MPMTIETSAKKITFNPWHFVWISVVASEILTALLNILQSYLLYGEYSPRLIKIGTLDAAFVPLVVAPIIIYFMRRTADLVKNNEQLLHEIEERKRIEAALRDSEQKLALHVNQTPLGVIEWDLEFKVETWNPAAEFIFGYSEREAIGSDLLFIVPDHYKEDMVQQWYDLIEQKKGMRSTDVNITKTGNIIYCEWFNTPLVDTRGKVIGVASFVKDITARKKIEETLRSSESKYRRLHQSMMDGYMYMNMNGNIQDFNESYRHMLGYGPEELKRLNFRDITPPRWHELQDSIINEQVLTRGYSDVYEKEYRKKDGTIFPAEIRTSLIKDDSGASIGMWSIVRDITERKLAQKEKDKLYHERIEEKQRHLTEREGILMDLHDGVGGLVTNIRLLADLSQKMNNSESMKSKMATISQLSEEAILEIRGLMRSLDRSELNWRTLGTLLRSEGAVIIEAHGMRFTADVKVDASDEPGSLLWVNLFRIYKEALTNIIKHAHAKSVSVNLFISNDKLTLVVEDDGIGWSGQASFGRGLSIMQKRANNVGGTVTVRARNPGTRLSLEIPLPPRRSPETSDVRIDPL